ncbi:hypothetical protein BH23ACT10_BH23ACT10_16220 [soil metagenome]
MASGRTVARAWLHDEALAVRVTAALVADTGSRSVLSDSHAQRLAREALLLVFGTRPAIRDALRRRLM